MVSDAATPRPPTFRLSDAASIPEEMRVSELKDTRGAWNIPLITTMFPPEDVEAILSIPESRGGRPDKLRWHFTQDGEYSVQIGYRVATEATVMEGPSSKSGNGEWWNKLWSLNIPPKVKSFLWRVCRGWIPTRTLLQHRHISSDGRCPVCVTEGETIHHAFWGCHWAKKVWKLGEFKDLIRCFRGGDTIVMLLLASTRLKVRTFELFLIIMWELWNHRNEVCSGQKVWKPDALLEWSGLFLRDYQEACGVLKEKREAAPPRKWNPPPTNKVAISVDAAVRAKDRRIGLGVIARNTKGEILGSETKIIHLGLSPKFLKLRRCFKVCFLRLIWVGLVWLCNPIVLKLSWLPEGARRRLRS